MVFWPNVTFTTLSAISQLLDSPVAHEFTGTRLLGSSCYGTYPQLYNTYETSSKCPPVNTIDTNETCRGWNNRTNTPGLSPLCISFCETSSQWSYLPEVPVPGTYCVGPRDCAVPASTKLPLRPQSWKAQLGIRKILALANGLGPPWSGSEAASFANMTGARISLDNGTCGYWTFVPIHRQVCGVLTEADISHDNNECINPSTTTNFCSDSIFESSHGGGYGSLLFVKTDCQTQTLDRDATLEISPAYAAPGVELGRDTRNAHLKSWIETTCHVEMNISFDSTQFEHDFEVYDLVAEIKGRVMPLEVVGYGGSNLKAKMEVCGNISLFNFTWLGRPGHENEWEWNAQLVFNQSDISTIQLEYTRHCVGSILLDLGGTRDQCFFHGLPYNSRGDALMDWI